MTQLEQAIFPYVPEALADDSVLSAAGFTRLYLGAEFCGRLLLQQKDRLARWARSFRDQGLALSFVSPPLFENEFSAACRLLESLCREFPGAELVFNDPGLLRRARERQWPNPRVLGHCLSPAVDYEAGAAYFARYGIVRAESDRPEDFPSEGIPLSLYRPRHYVNSTRWCSYLATVGGRPWSTESCAGECIGRRFAITNPRMEDTVHCLGNGHFIAAADEAPVHPRIDRRVLLLHP